MKLLALAFLFADCATQKPAARGILTPGEDLSAQLDSSQPGSATVTHPLELELDAEQAALRKLVHIELEIGETTTCSRFATEAGIPHEVTRPTLVVTNVSDQTLWVTAGDLVKRRYFDGESWIGAVTPGTFCGNSSHPVAFPPGTTLHRSIRGLEFSYQLDASRETGAPLPEAQPDFRLGREHAQGDLVQFGLRVALEQNVGGFFFGHEYQDVWGLPVSATVGAETPHVELWFVD